MEAKLPNIYWREVVNTIVYTFNRVHIKGDIGKTPYELWFGRTPTIRYFKKIGSKCYIRRDDALGKFDPRSDEGKFLGYSTKRKAYICYNKILNRIIERINVKVDEQDNNQIKSYDYGPEDEFVRSELIVQESVQSIDPIALVTSENSTVTNEG